MVKPTRTTPVQKEDFVTKYPYTADDVGKVKVNNVESELSQSEKEAMAAQWNINWEAGLAKYYQSLRGKSYPMWQDQLDKLYHDVNSGKFGADAKTGEWFKALKKVKDDNPKS